MSSPQSSGKGRNPMSQAMYDAAVQGGAKGAAGGLAVSVPTAYLLHQRWPAFRALTLPLKALFVTAATISAGIITADKTGLAYEAEHYTDEGANKMRRYASREEKQWAQLTPQDKALTWAKENKFAIVGGSWIASMAGVGAYLQAQPMSFSQKLVQTRVWAQGLTLASLLGMAAITQIPSAGDKILEERHHAADHSWRDFVDAESDEEQAHRIMRRREGNSGGNGNGSSGKSSSSASSGDGTGNGNSTGNPKSSSHVGVKKSDKPDSNEGHNDKYDDGSKSGNVKPGPKLTNSKTQKAYSEEGSKGSGGGGGGGNSGHNDKYDDGSKSGNVKPGPKLNNAKKQEAYSQE